MPLSSSSEALRRRPEMEPDRMRWRGRWRGGGREEGQERQRGLENVRGGRNISLVRCVCWHLIDLEDARHENFVMLESF